MDSTVVQNPFSCVFFIMFSPSNFSRLRRRAACHFIKEEESTLYKTKHTPNTTSYIHATSDSEWPMHELGATSPSVPWQAFQNFSLLPSHM
uniref:Uncharacterized protein n=1 Tax=Arundo donax TaxID=35708 RepID=A0A0A8XT98_ARUDO